MAASLEDLNSQSSSLRQWYARYIKRSNRSHSPYLPPPHPWVEQPYPTFVSTPEHEHARDQTSLPLSSGTNVHEDHPTRKNDPLGDLWHEALCRYRGVVGVDLTDDTTELSQELAKCSDYLAIVNLLDKTAQDFEIYRHPSPESVGAKVRGALRHIVHAVLSIGVLEASGEAAAAGAVPGGKAIFVAIAVLLKATQGVSDRFDAVIALLKKFEYYLARLDLRLGVPIRQTSRDFTVKTLVEILNALALATQMMRKNRAKHFISVVLGQGNEIGDASRRFEDLMKEDARLTLEEIHREMYTLSQSLLHAFTQMETTIESIDRRTDIIAGRTEAMYTDLTVVSMKLENAGIYELRRPIMSMLAILEQWHATQDVVVGRPESSKSLAVRENDMYTQGTTSIWRARASDTFFDTVSSLEHLVTSMLSCFRNSSPSDQAVLRRMLYSLAAVAVNISTSGDLDNVWCAVLVDPWAFMTVFLPMAAVYAIAYLSWRHDRSLRLPNIPRAPRHSRSDTIIIIDVLGLHMLLPLDRFESWENVHDFLLEQFTGRKGVEYVQSRSYTIMDVDEETRVSAIGPSSWAQRVRPGMTLEMSITVRQLTRSLQCPWCKAVSAESQALNNEWTRCSRCDRQFAASTEILAMADGVSTESSSLDPTAIEARDHPESATAVVSTPMQQEISRGFSPAQANDHETSFAVLTGESLARDATAGPNVQSKLTDDMTPFRRITVQHVYVDSDEIVAKDPSSTSSDPEASSTMPPTLSTSLVELMRQPATRAVVDHLVERVMATTDYALGRAAGSSSTESTPSHQHGDSKFSAFVHVMISRAEVEVFVILATLIYLDRAHPHLQIALEEWAYERVFLGSLIVAYKYIGVGPLKNVHWAMCTGIFGKRDIGRIEREFISVLDWELSISEEDILGQLSSLQPLLLESQDSLLSTHPRSWVQTTASESTSHDTPPVFTIQHPSSSSLASLSPRSPPENHHENVVTEADTEPSRPPSPAIVVSAPTGQKSKSRLARWPLLNRLNRSQSPRRGTKGS